MKLPLPPIRRPQDPLDAETVTKGKGLNLGLRRGNRAGTLHQGRPASTQLSDRETQVLQLIADGHADKQVAAQLDITYYTVKAHLKNIYGKLGVRSAPHAVAQGFRQGLIT